MSDDDAIALRGAGFEEMWEGRWQARTVGGVATFKNGVWSVRVGRAFGSAKTAREAMDEVRRDFERQGATR